MRFQDTPADPKDYMPVRLAMNYGSTEVSNVEDLINDEMVAFEQKFDGTRCMVVVNVGYQGSHFIRFLGRGGGLLTHAAARLRFGPIRDALTEHLRQAGEYVIDGEIMIDTGEFIAFDLPYVKREGWKIGPTEPFEIRHEALDYLLDKVPEPVRVARTRFTPEGKRALYDAVLAENGEGVMAKRIDSPYEPGKRVSHSLKVKFVRTADVVVHKSTRGRNAAGRETGGFSFGVYDETGRFRKLGSCSAIGKPQVEVGDVIEVAYLSWVPGGSLVQPRMRRLRPDKAPTECLLDQLTAYSKAVL